MAWTNPGRRFVLAALVACWLSPPIAAQPSPGRPAVPTPEVQALVDKALEAMVKGDRREMLRLAERARQVARDRKDRRGECEALRWMAQAYWALRREDGRKEINHRTLEVTEEALAVAREVGDRQSEWEALSALGDAYFDLGQPAKAANVWEQALPVLDAVGDSGSKGALRGNIAVANSFLAQPAKALDHERARLAEARQNADPFGEAYALSGLGHAYQSLGQARRAMEQYQLALAKGRAIRNRFIETDALGSIGGLYQTLGDPQTALEYGEKALTACRTSDRSELLWVLEPDFLNQIGNVYLSAGQPRRALEYKERALFTARQTGNRTLRAAMLISTAEIYLRLGQPRRALEYLHTATESARLAGNRQMELSALESMGRSYNALGRPAKALGCFRQVLLALRKNGNTRATTPALTGIGDALRQLRKPWQALASYSQALAVSVKAGDLPTQAGLLDRIGAAEQTVRRPELALQAYRRSVALYERIRANLGGYTDVKSSYLANHFDAYYQCLRLELGLGHGSEAFAVAQKTKARSLLDLLSSGRVELNAALTPEERDQEQELRDQADVLNAAMVREGVENEVGSRKRYQDLRERLRGVESRLQTLENTLYSRHPELARKRVARTTTLEEVARRLPAGTALLEYVVAARDDVRLFVVTKDGGKPRLRVVRIPGDYASLQRDAAQFHTACSDPRKPYLNLAQRLYARLIKPAGELGAARKRWVICPDGALWDVPFAALFQGEVPLGARHELAYAYSATGAEAALGRTARRETPSGSILVAANPTFGTAARFGDLKGLPGQRPIDTASRPIDSASRPIDTPSRPIDSASRPIDSASRPIDIASRALDTVSRGPRSKSIPPLPGTQREADTLLRLFPDARILTGEQAQEATIKQLAGDYRYLHLATHGFVNDGSPLLSSVVLAAPKDDGEKEDGFLTAREIYGLNLKAQMAVLSACNTARGENRTGEGVIGLTWALFVAGCPTQVVSQWAVDDASTALLMGRFYENLKIRKLGKARALQEAEEWLQARDRKYRHPYYWAPFVLNGAWD